MTTLKKFATENGFTPTMYQVEGGEQIHCFEKDYVKDLPSLPEGVVRYKVRESDTGSRPATIEHFVSVNYWSDILTDHKLELGEDKFLSIDSKWWYSELTIGMEIYCNHEDEEGNEIDGTFIIQALGNKEKPFIDDADDMVTLQSEDDKDYVVEVPVYSLDY